MKSSPQDSGWTTWWMELICYVLTQERARFEGLDHDFSFRHKMFRVLLKHRFISHSFGSLKVREEIRVF